MNLKSRYRLMIVLFLISTTVIGSEIVPKPKKIKNEAETAYNQGNYYLAIEKYEEYRKLNEGDNDALFNLANLYYSTRDYKNAIELYKPILKIKGNKYKDAYYNYAKILMAFQDFEGAQEYFYKVKKSSKGLSDRKNKLKLIRNYLKACEKQINGVTVPDDIIVTVRNLGSDVNRKHMDYGAFPLNDSVIMYSSLRLDETEKKADTKTGKQVRKLHLAKKRDSIWVYDQELDPSVNLPGIHTSNGIMSEDGSKFYFTQSRLNWKRELISEIFLSTKDEEGQWTIPERLPYPINDENSTNTHPALGKDTRSGRDVFYWVSNREGGVGGMDIWFVVYNPKTEEWTTPKNAGRKINTPGDEITPFYDMKRHELYFSSNGWEGIGGYDVYKARGSGSSWKPNTLLMQPINSGYDESYFILEENDIAKRTQGYIASNRPDDNQIFKGTCCEDLYAFTIDKMTVSSVTGHIFCETNTTFFDLLKQKFDINVPAVKQGDPLGNVQVYLYEKEKGEQDFLVSKTLSDRDGNFKFDTDPNKDYFVRVENYGFFDKRKNFNTKVNTENDTLELNPIGLNFIRPDIILRLDIYFEYDKEGLTNDAKQVVDTTILEVINMLPNAVFEISSHTDDHGSEEYNLKLSEQRAAAIKDYLVKKGVDEERLVSVGYGESRPIAENKNPDGSDNPEGRAKNRRSEIRIIDSVNTQYKDDEDEEKKSNGINSIIKLN